MSACGRNKNEHLALQVFEMMKDDAGIEAVDNRIFNGLIRSLSDSPDKALDCLRLMSENALRPDLQNLNCVLSVVASAGKWEKALEILDQIEEQGFTPDRFSYQVRYFLKEISWRMGTFWWKLYPTI